MRMTIFALLALAGSAAGAGELPFLKPTVSYSGMRIITTPEGDFRQKVYWSPEKVRTETDMPGMSMVNIVRQDLGVMWILTPDGGVCLEQTLDENEAMAMSPAYEDDDVEFKKLGEETVDGLPTTKYEVTSTDDLGTNRALFWVTEENIPVRMEVDPASTDDSYRVVIRLTELQTGPLSDSLFETKVQCRPMPAPPTAKPPQSP